MSRFSETFVFLLHNVQKGRYGIFRDLSVSSVFDGRIVSWEERSE